MLLLALYLLLGLSYLARPRAVTLIAIAATGVLLLSLRLVYVPVTLVSAALIPLLAYANQNGGWAAPKGRKRFLAQVVLSLLATLGLHQAYKAVSGLRADLPPAYQYANGFFLAAAWAPLIEPEDATDPRTRRVVEDLLAGGPYPLRSYSARPNQLWSEGGLKSEMVKAFGGDAYSANLAAQHMSIRTFRRVPLGVIRTAARAYGGYWHPPRMYQQLLDEQGTRRGPDSSFLRNLKDRFNLDAAAISATMTPSKRYHLMGAPWYIVLTVSPLIGLLSVLWCRRNARSGALLLSVTGAMLLVVSCLVVVGPGVRLLHPLVFGTLVALAVIADGAFWRLMKPGE